MGSLTLNGGSNCKDNNSILSLPDEIFYNIFKFLKVKQIIPIIQTCKRFKRLLSHDFIWNELLNYCKFDFIDFTALNLKKKILSCKENFVFQYIINRILNSTFPISRSKENLISFMKEGNSSFYAFPCMNRFCLEFNNSPKNNSNKNRNQNQDQNETITEIEHYKIINEEETKDYFSCFQIGKPSILFYNFEFFYSKSPSRSRLYPLRNDCIQIHFPFTSKDSMDFFVNLMIDTINKHYIHSNDSMVKDIPLLLVSNGKVESAKCFKYSDNIWNSLAIHICRWKETNNKIHQ